MIKIYHGVCYLEFPIQPCWRDTRVKIIDLPDKFNQLLLNKFCKFYLELRKKNKILEFTIGLDEATRIRAISIVHPQDIFSPDIGYKIVTGRILRQKKGKKYVSIPKYINIQH